MEKSSADRMEKSENMNSLQGNILEKMESTKEKPANNLATMGHTMVKLGNN